MESMVKKTVLITGGAGFIGGHLVELLIKKNFRVIVIDIQKRSHTYFFLHSLDKKSTYRIVDITEKKHVDTFFTAIHPNYVIHLAAQPTVEFAYDHPLKAFETNIMGTVNILEACRKNKKIEGIIVASSDKAYGKTKNTCTEESPLKGDHPYEVSKSCGDLIAQTYFKTYNMPIIITRFGNVYGEGDIHFDRIIPGICKSVVTGKTFIIRSDGTYMRDYVHVKDVAEGYYFLMKHTHKIKGEAFNLSSNDSYSVINLVKQAERILGKKIPYRIENSAINEIPYQHLNATKINNLGWKPTHSLQTTLPFILRWYKTFLNSSL